MEQHPSRPEPDDVAQNQSRPEPEQDIAAKLKDLEEEAERLRQQLKESEEAEKQPEAHQRMPPEQAAGAPHPAILQPDLPKAEPSPEDLAAAEGFVRQAKVAKMRGQTRECIELLQRAEALAPNLAAIHEALGDEFAAKSRWKDAQAAYGRASKEDPHNVQIERKYAEAVLKASIPFEALMLGGGKTTTEDVAGAKTAAIFSFFFPGTGQMVLGETGKGIAMLGGWLLALVIAFLIPNGIGGVLRMAGGSRGSDPNLVVLLPIGVAIVIWLSSIYDCTTRAKTIQRKPAARPQPPVDLPFE